MIYRHKKTGGYYELLHRDAIDEATGVRVVVYRACLNGRVWVRSEAEFFDGRFEPYVDPTHPGDQTGGGR